MTDRRCPCHRRGFLALAAAAGTLLATRPFGRRAAAAEPPEVPGAPKSAESRVLGVGADLLQHKSPIDAINMYLDGFHFYADDMGRQIEAHHYCSQLNEEFFQCVIYDGNATGSRLIGLEYIISARLFESLPAEEKPLWHSHRHETTSGELVMPGIPRAVEHKAIGELVSTYGKTWHTWQIDRDAALPLGIPQLMMGFTADGQLQPGLLEGRNRRLGLSADTERENRADLAAGAPAPLPGADAWQTGDSRQLALQTVPLKNRR